MEKFLEVIYYYTFIFYNNILKEDEPHATTVWGIGAAIGVNVGIFFQFLYIDLFGDDDIVVILSTIVGAISIYLTYRYYIKGKRSRAIIKRKPFIISPKFSGCMVVGIFIALLSLMFVIGSTYGSYLNRKHKGKPRTYRERYPSYIPPRKEPMQEKEEEFCLDSLLFHLQVP